MRWQLSTYLLWQHHIKAKVRHGRKCVHLMIGHWLFLDFLGRRNGITNEFRYHTLGVQILLGVIRSASKMSILDFANEYLFKPLGIKPREKCKLYI